MEVENRLCTTFILLEAVLDSKVDDAVTLKIQRGGENKVIAFKVQDLHAQIPAEFFSTSSAIIHPLSYHHAKNYNLPVGLVYVASTLLLAANPPRQSKIFNKSLKVFQVCVR